jgi:hypothetical protein
VQRGGEMKTYRVYLTDRDSAVDLKSIDRFDITENIITFSDSLDKVVAVFVIKNIKGFREVQ